MFPLMEKQILHTEKQFVVPEGFSMNTSTTETATPLNMKGRPVLPVMAMAMS